MELATQVAPDINIYETNLRANFESMRVLWKRDLTFVTVTHVDDLALQNHQVVAGCHCERV